MIGSASFPIEKKVTENTEITTNHVFDYSDKPIKISAVQPDGLRDAVKWFVYLVIAFMLIGAIVGGLGALGAFGD